MVAPGVGLDDDALFAPEEFDLVAVRACVHLGLGKTVAAAEAAEDPFEFAAGEVSSLLEVV